MKKALSLLLALVLLTAACGDDDSGGASIDPASAGTCGELADVMINLFQVAIDSVSDLSVTDFMALADGEDMPEEIQRLDTIGDAIGDRAAELGCSDEEGQQLVCDRIGNLKADGDVAQLLIAGIASDCG
ncbi:MAG: hypothetical protein MUP76_02150 [Acidimicrobiia bacterium]|nr:hypothetical protein [Acidimicrobiia bacterium]